VFVVMQCRQNNRHVYGVSKSLAFKFFDFPEGLSTVTLRESLKIISACQMSDDVDCDSWALRSLAARKCNRYLAESLGGVAHLIAGDKRQNYACFPEVNKSTSRKHRITHFDILTLMNETITTEEVSAKVRAVNAIVHL
jgi:hypothetical protein